MATFQFFSLNFDQKKHIKFGSLANLKEMNESDSESTNYFLGQMSFLIY